MDSIRSKSVSAGRVREDFFLPPLPRTLNFKSIYGFLVVVLTTVMQSCSSHRTSIIFLDNHIIDTLPFASEPFSNIIQLETIVKDKGYKFVFDTGTSKSLLNSEIPTKKFSDDTTYFLDIINHQHSAIQVVVDTIQIGKMKVFDMHYVRQRSLNIDGILGNEILGNLVWKIDFFNRKVYATQDVKNFHVMSEGIPITRNGSYI